MIYSGIFLRPEIFQFLEIQLNVSLNTINIYISTLSYSPVDLRSRKINQNPELKKLFRDYPVLLFFH